VKFKNDGGFSTATSLGNNGLNETVAQGNG